MRFKVCTFTFDSFSFWFGFWFLFCLLFFCSQAKMCLKTFAFFYVLVCFFSFAFCLTWVSHTQPIQPTIVQLLWKERFMHFVQCVSLAFVHSSCSTATAIINLRQKTTHISTAASYSSHRVECFFSILYGLLFLVFNFDRRATFT